MLLNKKKRSIEVHREVGFFCRVMSFLAVRIVEFVPVARHLPTAVSSLGSPFIFGVAEFGRRLLFQAEFWGSPRLMRMPSVHGSTTQESLSGYGLFACERDKIVAEFGKRLYSWSGVFGDPWLLGICLKSGKYLAFDRIEHGSAIRNVPHGAL